MTGQQFETTEDMTRALSAALKTKRVERGLTLATVAQAISDRGHDVATSQISDWETGRRRPQLDSLVRWADALGYDVCLVLTRREGEA